MLSTNTGVSNIFHLFAYNKFFCDIDLYHIQVMKALLICFEVVFSLKVNTGKFEMVLVGEVRNTRILASILGCKVASSRMKYLGLPLGVTGPLSRPRLFGMGLLTNLRGD